MSCWPSPLRWFPFFQNNVLFNSSKQLRRSSTIFVVTRLMCGDCYLSWFNADWWLMIAEWKDIDDMLIKGFQIRLVLKLHSNLWLKVCPKVLRSLFWSESRRPHPARYSWIRQSPGSFPRDEYPDCSRAIFELLLCFAKIGRWLPEDWCFLADPS